MGQIEVYEYLKRQGLSGNHLWVNSRMIADALGCRVDVARGDLVRLALAGYMDTKPANSFGDWIGWFRLKAKYIKPKRALSKSDLIRK